MKVYEITGARFGKDLKAVGTQLAQDADEIKKAMRYTDDKVDLGVSSNLKGVDANFTSDGGHKFGFKSDFRGKDPQLSWNKKTGKNSEVSATLRRGGANINWKARF